MKKVDIFKGTTRPQMFWGVPFIFGVALGLSSLIFLMWSMVLLKSNLKILGAVVAIEFTLIITAWLIAQAMTKRDPYRLMQVFERFIIRMGQKNFKEVQEFVYAPTSIIKHQSPFIG
jgi:type IV secretory pathway VirB3-like protein